MGVSRPNVVLVLADQWRAQACGYAGNDQVQTPVIDQFAANSHNFTHALSGIPVCTPARGCLLTGQYALSHGLFLNDVHLADDVDSMGKIFKRNGYETAYIGKWHVDGRGRDAPIPIESRQGFDYWKVLECTHDYNHSIYYDQDAPQPSLWEEYDAIVQTKDACSYIENRDQDAPFLMCLSWGPPHAPYETAPAAYRERYDAGSLRLRPNVTPEMDAQAREWIAGYYAHCTVLDDCFAQLLNCLEETGIADNTIVLFFSDHGDMLGSQGQTKKQRPWEESIRVPFLLRYPRGLGAAGSVREAPIDTVDVLPTLMDLCGIEPQASIQGLNFGPYLKGGEDPSGGQALVMCIHPFGQFTVEKDGGREYRGIVTNRHTYVESLEGPWLLYDNQSDPYQLENLVNQPSVAVEQAELHEKLHAMLRDRGDDFLPSKEYIAKWGYTIDDTGTVGYHFKYGKSS
jgi:arylsulfatase A-like enzyme